MPVFCNFGQNDFVRWLMSGGFVRHSKRALSLHYDCKLYFCHLFSQQPICQCFFLLFVWQNISTKASFFFQNNFAQLAIWRQLKAHLVPPLQDQQHQQPSLPRKLERGNLPPSSTRPTNRTLRTVTTWHYMWHTVSLPC